VNCRLKDEDLRLLAPGIDPLPEDFDLYRSDRYRGLRSLASYSRWVEYHGQLQRTLKKVDMASMFHSLEVRVPLLDREVIETALRIDPDDCMRGGRRKTILLELLGRQVSTDEIPAEKRGFAVPLGNWLRGPLRCMVEQTLLDRPLYPQGIFSRNGVRRYWDDHLSGRADCKWGLWTLLTLQWWARANGLTD
jgi:asparagine synthase (glutamine-hydrolysing)